MNKLSFLFLLLILQTYTSNIHINVNEQKINNEDLKIRCFEGDTIACNEISKNIFDSCNTIPRSTNGDPSNQLNCYRISMLYQSLELYFIRSKTIEKQYGSNSVEYLDSKRMIYNFLKLTDSCRKMPPNIYSPE